MQRADCELRAKDAHGGVEPAEQSVDPLIASNQAEGDRASGGRIELEKVRSSEGKRVSWLREQLRHSEPCTCQASAKISKITGEESPYILPCLHEGLEKGQKLSSGMRFFAHAQNDVTIHEKQIFNYNLNENEDTPSTNGRGIEFQHDRGVLEILGEGAVKLLRFLLASLASSRATLHFDLTFSQLKTESLRQMTFGYALRDMSVNTCKHSAQNDGTAHESFSSIKQPKYTLNIHLKLLTDKNYWKNLPK